MWYNRVKAHLNQQIMSVETTPTLNQLSLQMDECNYKLDAFDYSISQHFEKLSGDIKQTLEEAFKSRKHPRIGGVQLAVKATGFSKSKIYNLVSKKAIPFFRIDGILRFNEDTLYNWLTKIEREFEAEIELKNFFDNYTFKKFF